MGGKSFSFHYMVRALVLRVLKSLFLASPNPKVRLNWWSYSQKNWLFYHSAQPKMVVHYSSKAKNGKKKKKKNKKTKKQKTKNNNQKTKNKKQIFFFNFFLFLHSHYFDYFTDFFSFFLTLFFYLHFFHFYLSISLFTFSLHLYSEFLSSSITDLHEPNCHKPSSPTLLRPTPSVDPARRSPQLTDLPPLLTSLPCPNADL